MPNQRELEQLQEYLNYGRQLSRIAAATERLAQSKAPEAASAEHRRRLASGLLFGDNRSVFAAIGELGELESLAQEEARIAAIDTSMHRIGSETLSGQQSYTERKLEIPQGVEIRNPESVKRYLDGVVKGQEGATKAFAVGIVDMYYRLVSATDKDAEKLDVEKNNYLLMGPSGVGKTYLAFTAADLIALPYVKVSATSLNAVDGQGVDFRDILKEYCKVDVYADKAGKRERRLTLREGAQYGVLFIDEVDKLRGREKLQHDLLPILERGEYRLGDGVSFDTGNLWVVAAGRFQGIEEVIRERLGTSPDVPTSLLLDRVTERDLVAYGFIPELARRFQTYVPFMPLSVDVLQSILTDTPNSLLSQYAKRFNLRGFGFEAEEGALRAIAEYSANHSEGANGLRTGFSKAAEDLLYQPKKYEKDGLIILTEEHTRKILT